MTDPASASATARTVADLGPTRLAALMRQGRLALQTGPLLSRLQTPLADVAAYVAQAYRHHPCVIDAEFVDVSVSVRRPFNLRRWLRSQVEFLVEGESPFEPLPREQAPALLEWGLNWTIASSCHQWLTVHAACLEREGRAVILPAPPGSGKSTLCAALALRGWRLLSDELTLLDPLDGQVWGLARPINLKNASIDLIQAFEPAAEWGPTTFDTRKGRVTHLCAPRHSVERMTQPAMPAWVVFPRYQAGAEPLLQPRGKAGTFTHFATNAFNYSILGELAFDAVGRLLDRCECFDFTYSRIDDALEVFDWLAGSPAPQTV
ncbi:MAG: HprK-related kinase A [Rubrivivax sp.]